MNVIGLIQARVDSERLPNKIYMDLGGKPMLQRVWEGANKATTLDKLMIAMPMETLPLYRDLPKRWGAEVFIPLVDVHEQDVLKRLTLAACYSGADFVVRICADNPFIQGRAIDILVNEAESKPELKLYSNAGDYIHSKWPDGIGVEGYFVDQLLWMDEYLTSRYNREHPHSFWHAAHSIIEPACPLDLQIKAKLDVNTREDYEKISDIFKHIPKDFEFRHVMEYLREKNLAE